MPLPRDPSAYAWGPHTEEALADPERFVTDALVEETIANGRDYPDEGGPGKMRRRMEIGRSGVDAVVVLPYDSPFVVTAWTEIASYERALASDRWSADDLRAITGFEDRASSRWN